jgi:hypothetical protein
MGVMQDIFLNGEKIEQKTYNFNSKGRKKHIDLILYDCFYCRIRYTADPILAVTDPGPALAKFQYGVVSPLLLTRT